MTVARKLHNVAHESKRKHSKKLATATARIDEAPRQFWKSLDSIVALKCGITKGKGLDLLKTVFYLTPQPVIGEFSEETLKSSARVNLLEPPKTSIEYLAGRGSL